MIFDPWRAASTLDHAEQRRDSPDWVADQWHREDARLLRVDDEGRLAVSDDTSLRLTRPVGEFDPERHVLVGLVDGSPVFTARGPVDDGPSAPLRTLNARLTGAWLDAATTSAALLNWHTLDPRCAGCGGPTGVASGGTTRRCRDCHRIHFPRTDSAVIVAVLNDAGELLLGHQASWDPGRVSLLAGFVEAGESLEQAVHREIGEESGVALGATRYVGSQPWPLPRSLMVGFVARATSLDIVVDGVEIEYARWFSRDRLAADLAAGTVSVPPPGTIAHRMIDAWRAGEVTAPA